MTKICIISDTHNQLSLIRPHIPECDILIHCGDATYFGKPEELVKFNAQMGKIKAKRKLFIPGNHELSLDINHRKYSNYAINYLYNMDVLINNTTEIDGLRIYTCSFGSRMPRWAFTNEEESVKKRYYDMIPEGIDILVTHFPPFGILDGKNWGCKSLLDAIDRIQPKYLFCGHVHSDYDSQKYGKTTIINAVCLDESYTYKNKPVIVDITHNKG
jgi:Icc-related predicted phosphoesterase